MTELERVAADVLVVGYVILIVALVWVIATAGSKSDAYEHGYRDGMDRGDRIGYERYANEIGAFRNVIPLEVAPDQDVPTTGLGTPPESDHLSRVVD